MPKKSVKRKSLYFYENAGNHQACIYGSSHNLENYTFAFKTKNKKQKSMLMVIEKCKKCGKFLIKPEKFMQIKNFCNGYKDRIYKYSFISGKEFSKVQTDTEKRFMQKQIVVYVLENSLFDHECGNKSLLIKKQLKTKDKYVIIDYCKTCSNYYCLKKDAVLYQNFSSRIKLVDYKKEKKEQEVEKYIRMNIDKFVQKEDVSFSSKLSKFSLTDDDYFRILSRIKHQNRYDFIVKGTTQFCINKNHKVCEIEAKVDIVDRNGNISNVSCPAYYCENCNVFYMYLDTYERLKQKGVLLCKIYDMYKFSNNNEYYDLNSESIMHSFGYNVNANENLSTLQRQIVLKNIVDNEIMSKNEIINHLSYLYNRSKNLTNYSQACRRWKEDIDFISDYKNNNSTLVKISTLKKINYIKK